VASKKQKAAAPERRSTIIRYRRNTS